MTFGSVKLDTVFKTGGKLVYRCIVILLVCSMPVSCTGSENASRQAINGKSEDLTDQQAADGLPAEGTLADVALQASGMLTDTEVQISGTVPGTEAQASNAMQDAADAALKLAEQVTDRKNDKIIRTPEDYNNAKMPLLAALPEKEAYLYGVKEGEGGVVLYIGDKVQYFDWQYLTPRFVLPVMQFGDYDRDGSDELAIDLYWGSGTGVSIEALHIIEISGYSSYKDNAFNDYASQLEKLVSFKTFVKEGELMGRIKTGGKNYDVSLREYQSEKCGKINDYLVLDSIVRFKIDKDTVTAEFGAGITSNVIAAAAYIGTVHCTVSYSEDEFELNDIRFEGDQI